MGKPLYTRLVFKSAVDQWTLDDIEDSRCSDCELNDREDMQSSLCEYHAGFDDGVKLMR